MNITKYDVVITMPHHLKEAVTNQLEEGWQPYGPPVVVLDGEEFPTVMQVMVQYQPELRAVPGDLHEYVEKYMVKAKPIGDNKCASHGEDDIR